MTKTKIFVTVLKLATHGGFMVWKSQESKRSKIPHLGTFKCNIKKLMAMLKIWSPFAVLMLIKSYLTIPLSDLSNMVPLTPPSRICTVCTKELYVMWFYVISMSLMKKVLCVQKIKDSLLFFYYRHPIHSKAVIYPSQPFIFLSSLLLFKLGKICHAARQTVSLLVKEVLFSILHLHWLHGKSQSYVA